MKHLFSGDEIAIEREDDRIEVLVDTDGEEADTLMSDGGDIAILKPQDDRIVVMLDEVPGEVRKGKIIVVTETKRPQFGNVLEVGPNVKSKDIVQGARICFGRYSGVEVELAGETYNIIRETDVLAVVLYDEELPGE